MTDTTPDGTLRPRLRVSVETWSAPHIRRTLAYFEQKTGLREGIDFSLALDDGRPVDPAAPIDVASEPGGRGNHVGLNLTFRRIKDMTAIATRCCVDHSGMGRH